MGLSCYICYDFINDAKLLHCGHIGCSQCITEWIESSKHSDNGSTCPKCRTLIETEPIRCLSIDHIIKYHKKLKPLKTKKNTLCICRAPYNSNDTYVHCSFCSNWYHPQCVGLRVDEIN